MTTDVIPEDLIEAASNAISRTGVSGTIRGEIGGEAYEALQLSVAQALLDERKAWAVAVDGFRVLISQISSEMQELRGEFEVSRARVKSIETMAEDRMWE